MQGIAAQENQKDAATVSPGCGVLLISRGDKAIERSVNRL